ncbi:cytidylyltransferase domain-containing protein [Fulvivirga sediminis]|uniref:Glycosyl transferase family 2 n=1 Tax=Fulvivirga sediminis TaxID=2803949 RepID=A0A937F454_9BACT|nr:hypothetical protein [Fulvivirga sediminis]MBL3655385.1 hypothetical protein [Fulvivirga sediminis]
MECDIIVQARMSSTRMPGKILKPFFKTESILEVQIGNIQCLVGSVIIATSNNSADDVLENFANGKGAKVFRGDEQDVMSRFIEGSSADFIIRICSDNPFLDLLYLQKLIDNVEEGIDYVSYKDYEGTPAIRTHWGLFAELVKRSALEKAYMLTENDENKSFYREHVTNYIYENPQLFKVKLLDAPAEVFHRKDLRFTIDTPEDFENMQNLYEKMITSEDPFNLSLLVKYADEDLMIKEIMQQGINKFSK